MSIEFCQIENKTLISFFFISSIILKEIRTEQEHKDIHEIMNHLSMNSDQSLQNIEISTSPPFCRTGWYDL